MSEFPDATPIACRMDALTAAERSRRGEALSILRGRLIRAVETDDGIAFHLAEHADTAALVMEFVSFESRCCPFLRFELEAGTDGTPIVLRMGGRPGVKEFLRQTFLHDLPVRLDPR